MSLCNFGCNPINSHSKYFHFLLIGLLTTILQSARTVTFLIMSPCLASVVSHCHL